MTNQVLLRDLYRQEHTEALAYALLLTQVPSAAAKAVEHAFVREANHPRNPPIRYFLAADIAAIAPDITSRHGYSPVHSHLYGTGDSPFAPAQRITTSEMHLPVAGTELIHAPVIAALHDAQKQNSTKEQALAVLHTWLTEIPENEQISYVLMHWLLQQRPVLPAAIPSHAISQTAALTASTEKRTAALYTTANNNMNRLLDSRSISFSDMLQAWIGILDIPVSDEVLAAIREAE